jgi:hypothetical protein
MKIKLTKISYEKKAGTKTVWVETEREKREITEEQYKNIIDAVPFFRRLGGSEYLERGYTECGYRVVRILSTSPNKECRVERRFNFVWE